MAISVFDGLFLSIAILMNVWIIFIFLARYRNYKKLEHLIGFFVLACGLPLFAILINYIWIGTDLWIIIYILIIISFLIFEMVLDYILKLNFRANPKIVGPYILYYYIAFWGLLAISFVIDLIAGFIVFAFFMANVVITIYTHKKEKSRMYGKESKLN